MSTGYLILFYKNNQIEFYIRNFLMTKYISLNNAIGANKLVSKIKYYHRNYFCFINKEKKIVRCIIKLNKITNNQIDLKIKNQQELSLNELKNFEIFKNENFIIENFFNLENNSDIIYANNKINLLIKESNNIYEFNCLFLEDSIDMGTFEKIKKCMKDKENMHTNQIQNNLRNNPFISNILNYEAFQNKCEEFVDKKKNHVMGNGVWTNFSKNENFFFDMKNDKYFLYDELLINKNDNQKLFDKNKLRTYIDLINEYKSIIEISETFFKKPFSELDNINMEISIKENNNNKIEIKENNKDNNSYKNLKSKNDENNIETINELNNSYKKEETNSNNIYNKNQNSNVKFPSRSLNNINNYSPIKEEKRYNDGYKRYDYRFDKYNRYNRFDSYNNNFKRNSLNNSFSYDNNNPNYNSNKNNNDNNYSNDNCFNRTEYNNNKYYYNQNNNDKYYNRENKYRDSNQYKSNSFNNDNYNNNNYINRRNERYNNHINNNYYRNNNYNYSYHSSNNNSFNSERQSFSRSRDKSDTFSSNQYSRYNSPRDKSYDNKYNDRNFNKNNSNNYYGDNNNINYYYNINNYYRQGSMNRWNDNNYYQKERNFQRNKSEYFNKSNNNYYNSNNNESQFYRDRRREKQTNED